MEPPYLYEDEESESSFFDKYKVIGLLGQGAFGQVVSATNKLTTEVVAVKIMSKLEMTDEEIKRVKKEAEVMKKFNHPNIVKYYGEIETPLKIYIIMEKLKGGTLSQLMKQRQAKGIKFTDMEASTLIKSLLEAVNYIHQFDIIHRDIKPDNILFKNKDDFRSLKLCDFGLCNDRDDDIIFEGKIGTPLYMAPEQMLKRYYCKAVDIWAVGIIMYMVIAGKHPLHSPGDTKDIYAKKLENPQWHFGKEFSNLARNLFVKLAAPDPLVRYKASQALKHPWITRLRTEIPLNLFETIRNVKALESFEAAVRVILFAVLADGGEKKVDELYEKAMNDSSKMIAEWYVQQEKASRKLLLNDDDFYKGESHSPVPPTIKLLKKYPDTENNSDASPVSCSPINKRCGAHISCPISPSSKHYNNTGLRYISKKPQDTFKACIAKHESKTNHRNALPLRLSQKTIQQQFSPTKQRKASSPRHIKKLSPQDLRQNRANHYMPPINNNHMDSYIKEQKEKEALFSLNLYQTATRFADIKEGYKRKTSQDIAILDGFRATRYKNAAERLGCSPVRPPKNKYFYKL